MADFSIDALDAVQAGTATADIVKKIANTARNSACQFFKSYPSVVIPNPAADLLFATWDGLCKNSTPGLPPSPQKPYNNGQCVCTSYAINFSMTFSDGSSRNGIISSNWGPITNVYIGPANTTTGKRNTVLCDCRGNHDAGQACSTPQTVQIFSVIPSIEVTSLTINSITGTPDNCGSPPINYPPPTTPPTPTQPGGNTYVLPSINLTYNDGTSLSVNPQLTLNFNAYPTLQIGGINVSIGGGGVTISPPTGTPPNIINYDPTNQFNNINNNINTVNNTVNNLTSNVSNISNQTNQIIKQTQPVPPPGGPGTNPPVTNPPSTNTIKNQTNLLSVEIILTTLPTLRNTIFGADSNYNVYIAGWFSWLQGSLAIARIPVQFQNNIFFAPKGADGFTYTLANGAAGYSVTNTGT